MVTTEKKNRFYRVVNAVNKSHLFASYSFSTICYFGMIAFLKALCAQCKVGGSDEKP